MPTSTFFRLDQVKKEKIINAAKNEFSQVSIQEASIAKIVKEAQIPRGSFYQYFNSKGDLYFYIFDELRKEPESVFYNLLKETKGDLFETFRSYFSYFTIEAFEGENRGFYKNLLSHMNFSSSNRITMSESIEEERPSREENLAFHQHSSSESVQKIMDEVDQSKMKVKSTKEFRMLFRLLWSILFNTINEGYRMEETKQRIDTEGLKQDFNQKISWLQHGVMK